MLNDEELVGPGSYEPREGFLSTKSKSPSAAIGRSERFLRDKVTLMKNQVRNFEENDLSGINYYLSEQACPPKYSFKRTGHNLILVKNTDFPGAGKYSPPLPSKNTSFVFSKAEKNFNWKKGKK